MKKKLIVGLLLLSCIIPIFALTDSTNIHIPWNWNKLSVTGMYQSGKVMPTNIFVRGSNTNSAVIDDYQELHFVITACMPIL